MEELVPKRLKAAVRLPLLSIRQEFLTRDGKERKEGSQVPGSAASMHLARKMEPICQEQGSPPQAAGTVQSGTPSTVWLPSRGASPGNRRDSLHHS